MMTPRYAFALLTLPFSLFLLAGCGTSIEEIIYQSTVATGRSAFDIFLTDLANSLADQFEGDDAALDDTNGDDGTGDGGDTNNGDDSNGGDAIDGGLDGATLFAANCSACHGSDGASGFAPDISGKSADEVIAAMSLSTHDSISLMDDELTAIAMFLSGDDGSVGGDAAAGETIFSTNGCGTCHCADASGGCALDAPSLQGKDADTLDTMLRSDAPHTGGKRDLTDQDIIDLAAYLQSLQ